MNFWNNVFFEKSTTVLTTKCLDMIEKDRKGEQIDKSLLKNVIESYSNVLFFMTVDDFSSLLIYDPSCLVSVGSSIHGNNADASTNLLRLYQNHFETHFLRATEEYYKNLASRYQLVGDVKSYVEKVRCSSAFSLSFMCSCFHSDFNIHQRGRRSC